MVYKEDGKDSGMSDDDLKVLDSLMKKAVKNQWYDVATKIRDAKNLIHHRGNVTQLLAKNKINPN